MCEHYHVGAWLPEKWESIFTEKEKELIKKSKIDLLLIPEEHEEWDERNKWKNIAEDIETSIFAGFRDDEWTKGLYYDPESGEEDYYIKHSSSEKIALEKSDWDPKKSLKTIPFRDFSVGTTICHDHYFSPFMAFQVINGASLLVNLSGEPVVREKWGEVLQARAIENSAYVICTMHGTKKDGTNPSKNTNGHVFAFNPYGERIKPTEIESGKKVKYKDTKRGNIYTIPVVPEEAKKAKNKLKSQGPRPDIQPIRDYEVENPETTETTLSVEIINDKTRLSYSDESTSISINSSKKFELGDKRFYLVTIKDQELFEPEKLYLELLSISDKKEINIIIHSHWSNLSNHYLKNVVEPILRSRSVEWACPVFLTSPRYSRCYEVTKTKLSRRILLSNQERYNLNLCLAKNVKSVMKSVHNKYDEMKYIAELCRKKRAKLTS
ncbi:MAG: nitrilase-related carbon-nitrogen hydrolase [Elusimicrobiota bacterium]